MSEPRVEPAAEQASEGFVADLYVAGQIVAALGISGILLGVAWAAWSPPGPRALVTTGGLQLAESESYVAGDGRYLVLSVAVGLVAGTVYLCNTVPSTFAFDKPFLGT